jgi:predicted dehydrogenase
VKKVSPGMLQGQHCEMVGIASRDLSKARMVAAELGLPKAYGSYEDLLADPEIEAVYIPLPNHLHVPWSIRALEAGKHVLCEKPIGLSAEEAERLLAASIRHPHLKVMEAFMYRHHPQWQRARQLARGGGIGDLKTIQAFFSYYNDDPANIRNLADIGGGGLMDIGCYCISLARFIFDADPQRVLGILEYDPVFKTDRLASGVMDFGTGTATWTCSTQLADYQRVTIMGTEGRVEIEIPFNAPPDRPCRIWHQRGAKVEEIVFDVVDQYGIQGDLFSLAVLNNTPVPTPLGDAVANMRAIEAVARSAKLGTWV